MLATVKIGEWDFSPSTGMLSQPGQTVRLEHRAASLLEFLCQRSADVVTHADILETIWEGRSLSPNSVAVVIADIRRALGDDARNPIYIQTLPKRGYCLIAPISTIASEQSEGFVPEEPNMVATSKRLIGRRLAIWIAGVIGVICLVTLFQMLRVDSSHEPPVVNIAIAPAENKTEDLNYGSLTQALSELMTTEIMRTGRYQVTSPEDADILLSGRVILWDGHTAMSLQAHSVEEDATIWSGMASGPENKLPMQVRREIRELTMTIDVKSPPVAP